MDDSDDGPDLSERFSLDHCKLNSSRSRHQRALLTGYFVRQVATVCEFVESGARWSVFVNSRLLVHLNGLRHQSLLGYHSWGRTALLRVYKPKERNGTRMDIAHDHGRGVSIRESYVPRLSIIQRASR